MRSTCVRSADELVRNGLAAMPDDWWVSDRLVVATEALADGSLTRRDLRRSYTKLHRNVYARAGVELTAVDRGRAAWLW